MEDHSFDIVTPKKFNKYLTKNKRLEFITVYPEFTLTKWKLLLSHTEEGGAGFAITPDRELANMFNNTSIKGLGAAMVRCAIDLGANKVFCFDGFLRGFYERFGFRLVGRESWDDKFAPANWKYKKYGKPDMVWLER